MQGLIRPTGSISKMLLTLFTLTLLVSASASRAAGLTFQVPFFVPTNNWQGYITNRTFNTVTGPDDGQRLFTGLRLISTGTPGEYLAIDFMTVYHMDTNEVAVAEATNGLELNNWPMSATYDSQSRRAVLVTLGGDGALFQRPTSSGAWSQLANMHNVDLDSLAYRASDNSFYGLRTYSGAPDVPATLFRYTANGERLRDILLPPFAVNIGPGYSPSGLFAVEGSLVAFIEQDWRQPITPQTRSRIYVINPDTGAMELTYEGAPATAPAIRFTTPTTNTTITLGQSVDIALEAFDANNDLRSITLSGDGTILKVSFFDAGTAGTNKVTLTWTPPTVGDRPLTARATDSRGNFSDVIIRITAIDPITSFAGWYWDDGELIGVSYKETGPTDGGTLFRGVPLAQAGYRYLGKENQSIFRVDNEHDTVVETAPGAGLPELSWPRGTAYDFKRGRFVVPSLGGEGFLYAVTPATLEWSLIASMENVDTDSIAYRALDDRYYMVERLYSGGRLRVLRYTPEGQPDSVINIDTAPFDVGGFYQSHLIDTGTKLALLVEPPQGWHPTPPVESRIYMIDQTTNVTLTYRKIWDTWPPVTNHAPVVRIVSPLENSTIRLGEKINVTVEAFDPDGNLLNVTLDSRNLFKTWSGDDLHAGTNRLTIEWTPDTSGDLNVAARVRDSSGLSGTATTHVKVISAPAITAVRDLPENYSVGLPVNVTLTVRPTNGVVAWAAEEQPPAGWILLGASHEGSFDPVTGKIKWGPFTDAQPRLLSYSLRWPEHSTGAKTFTGIVSANGESFPITGDQTINGLSQYHPADTAPQDSRVTVNEVTAYAAAWKSGAPWATAPSIITLPHVTRAGFLWKSGEQYRFIPTLQPPACWAPVVPTGKVAAASAPLALAGTANRVITAGVSVIVTVHIRPAAGVQSYGLEEVPPKGWTIVDAEGASVIDGVIRFGPFFDSQERSLVYRVAPSSGLGIFRGLASFDGSSEIVTGAGVLPPVVAEHRDGRVYLKCNVAAAEQFTLESAEAIDSFTWRFEANVTGGATAVELPAIKPADEHRFYRLRRITP